jgi:tetratricopeptide (TPR) repeat protein
MSFITFVQNLRDMFNKFVLFSFFCFAVVCADAQTIKTPQPSPTQTLKQDFGISSIDLIYSRPGMKGRKIFGDLVPYGKVWRTGANSATRIKFSDDVTIGGQLLKAGEYAIYTVPGEKEWEFIINKGSANWGTEYKQEDDIMRVKATPVKLDQTIESFTMQFANIKANSADLQLMWDKTMVAVPITTDIDKKIMAQIDAAMNKDNRPYFQAAMYYLETGKDLNQALVWFDKAIEQNQTAYWIYHQKANTLAKLGKKSEAKTTAQKSMDLAKTANNADYVKLNEKLIASLN